MIINNIKRKRTPGLNKFLVLGLALQIIISGSCAPKRITTTEKQSLAQNTPEKTRHMIQPKTYDASRLSVQNVKVNVVHQGQNRYPYISFDGDPNRDYVAYQVCHQSNCEQGMTAGESILVPELFSGMVIAKVKSCIRGQPGTQRNQDICGPEMEQRLSLQQPKNPDMDIDRWLKEKSALTSEFYILGQRFNYALKEFDADFPRCLKSDPNTKPFMSQEVRQDYLTLGPDMLGLALANFDREKFGQQMESSRMQQEEDQRASESDSKEEKGKDWNAYTDRMLFGIMGITAGAGMIISGVAMEAPTKIDAGMAGKVQKSGKYILIGAGVLSAAAGALMLGLGINDSMQLSSSCPANDKLKNEFQSVSESARMVREKINSLDGKIAMRTEDSDY